MSTEFPFPRRLKERRLHKRLSQKELGILAGIDESSSSSRMNQYEKGTHAPDYQTVERIARQLEVPSCYLYCDDDNVAELLLAYSRLSESGKKQLLDYIRGVEAEG